MALRLVGLSIISAARAAPAARMQISQRGMAAAAAEEVTYDLPVIWFYINGGLCTYDL